MDMHNGRRRSQQDAGKIAVKGMPPAMKQSMPPLNEKVRTAEQLNPSRLWRRSKHPDRGIESIQD
jgi:hypothetical protein